MSLPANASSVIATIPLKSPTGASLASLAYYTPFLSVFVRASNASSYTEYGEAGTSMVTATAGTYTTKGFIRVLTNAATVVAEFHVPAAHVVAGQAIEIIVAYNSELVGAWREVVNLPVADSSGRVDVGKLNGTAYASAGLVTNVAAIKAMTDNLPAQPAQESSVTAVSGAVTQVLNAVVGLEEDLGNAHDRIMAFPFEDGELLVSLSTAGLAQVTTIVGAASIGSGARIYSNVSYLGAVPPTLEEPVTLYKGRAQRLSWTFAYDGDDVENGDELTLRILTQDGYQDQSEDDVAALMEATTTATLADGTLSFDFDVTAEQTGALVAGTQGDGSTLHRLFVLGPDDAGAPVIEQQCVVKRVPGTVA